MAAGEPILIVGGRGMLAKALIAEYAASGRRPVALSRLDCDITRPEHIARAMAEHKPKTLINCAAYTAVDACEVDPESAEATNTDGVGYLAQAARAADCYLVHVSTDAVFDGRGDRPYTPDDPVGPLSTYAQSKLGGEQRLQASAPNRWMIVRTAWLFGIGGVSFPRTIIEKAKTGQALKVVNDQFGCPTYANDLAAAMVKLIDLARTGIWHVTNAGQASWYDVAIATLEEMNLKAEAEPISTQQWTALRPNQAIRPRYTVLNIDPVNAAAGPMRPWRAALADYCRTVRQ
jgi:dTDP-4-dehydrorhamnose reductase